MKRLVSVLGMALALSACGDDVTELSRQTSPDGTLDAVMVRVQAARGNESPFMVLMGPKGVGSSKAVRVFLADRTEAPEMAWSDNNHLTIRCESARVWTYHNFFNGPNNSHGASVALECGQAGFKP